MTGLDTNIRVGPIGPSRDTSTSTRLPFPVLTALRSAPAQKVPPVPVSTAASRSSRWSNSRNAFAKSAAVGPSTALRTSGRALVTTQMPPSSCSVVIVMSRISSTGRSGHRLAAGRRRVRYRRQRPRWTEAHSAGECVGNLGQRVQRVNVVVEQRDLAPDDAITVGDRTPQCRELLALGSGQRRQVTVM